MSLEIFKPEEFIKEKLKERREKTALHILKSIYAASNPVDLSKLQGDIFYDLAEIAIEQADVLLRLLDQETEDE